MKFVAVALTIAGSAFGCVGTPATDSATGVRPEASSIAIAARSPAAPPSCEPVKIERQVVRPLHLGMCTE
jgi:hypothetical protein